MQEQVKKFLNSDLTEKEYYSVEEDNAVTLKEYLLQLHDIDNEFQSAIKEQFNLIAQKCNWLKSIYFDGLMLDNNDYNMISIYLDSKDGIDIIAKYNSSTDKYEELVKNTPRIYLLSKKFKKKISRMEDLELIQNELREIENIGRNLYKDALKATSSISNNFNIYYSPQYGLYVYNKDDLIVNYEVTDKKAKDDVYFKDADSKEKLANRILVKSNKKDSI